MIYRPLQYINANAPVFADTESFLKALTTNPPLLRLLLNDLSYKPPLSPGTTLVSIKSQNWLHSASLADDLCACRTLAERVTFKPITKDHAERVELTLRISPNSFREAYRTYRSIIQAHQLPTPMETQIKPPGREHETTPAG